MTFLFACSFETRHPELRTLLYECSQGKQAVGDE